MGWNLFINENRNTAFKEWESNACSWELKMLKSKRWCTAKGDSQKA